jgi:hypothetical protein
MEQSFSVVLLYGFQPFDDGGLQEGSSVCLEI